jgi:soluble lytic murein transglycosylase
MADGGDVIRQDRGVCRPLFFQKNVVLWSGAFLVVSVVSFQPQDAVLTLRAEQALGPSRTVDRPDIGVKHPVAVLSPAGSASPATLPAGPALGVLPGHGLDQVYVWLRNYRTGLKPAEKRRLATILYEESLQHQFDPALIMALVATESSVFNWSRSHRGAIGLMQLQPGTAQFVADRLADPEIEFALEGEELLFDPAVNLKLGVRYLAHLRHRFGDMKTALTAYNYGPTRVSDWLSQCEPLPTGYADRVLELSEEFHDQVRMASGPAPLSG